MDYTQLPAGACKRFKARDPANPAKLGTGLRHPDGSATIQWWNVLAGGGEALTEIADFACEEDPHFVEWDERMGDASY